MNIHIEGGVLIQGGNIYIGRTALEYYFFENQSATDLFITEDGNYLVDQDYYF